MIERGKYNIEWIKHPNRDEPSILWWVIVVVSVATLVSLIYALVTRIATEKEEVQYIEEVREATVPSQPDKPQTAEMVAAAKPAVSAERAAFEKRPRAVKNLLLRLEEAERRRDIEMTVSTIESLRALPGSPAADLDDALARRLGTLNFERLFTHKSGQWVKQVVVRAGQSASRIAAENGSTFASMRRLNDGSLDKIMVGSKLYVMDHPRFNLVIHSRLKTADLQLNGKFFRRYDLTAETMVKEGVYEVAAGRAILKAVGNSMRTADLAELELLMPVGSSVLVSKL